jgi:hypothetical protein
MLKFGQNLHCKNEKHLTLGLRTVIRHYRPRFFVKSVKKIYKNCAILENPGICYCCHVAEISTTAAHVSVSLPVDQLIISEHWQKTSLEVGILNLLWRRKNVDCTGWGAQSWTVFCGPAAVAIGGCERKD